MKYFLILSLSGAWTFFSCTNSGRSNENSDQLLTRDSTENQNTGNKIDYDNTVVLQTLFVSDRNGADMKQQADKNSETLGRYEYGTRLDVIEITDEWLGVRDRITRKFIERKKS